MKKLIFACLLSLGTVAVLQAQDTTSTESDRLQNPPADQQQPAPSDDYTDKDMIAATDLPAPIQDKLKSTDYSGWTVSKAFRKMKDGQTLYAVELKNGTDTKKVKFDAQGNVLKEKDKG